jgi:hypothetical protein
MTTQAKEKMSWADLKAMLAELAEQSKETDRRMQETDRMLKALGRQIAGLGDKFGYFTEGLALPSMERILRTRFRMETVSPRVRVRQGGQEREYDVLAWANGGVNLGVREEAMAAGLYTARIHDDMFELTTPEDFQPRRWEPA